MKFLKLILFLIISIPERVFGVLKDEYRANNNLTKIAIDNYTGKVYVGGVNTLLELNQSLSLVQSKTIGPIDNPSCLPLPHPCPENQVSTDNLVSILEINEKSNFLLMCGTVNHGLCSAYNMTNINSAVRTFNESNAAAYIGTKSASVVLFNKTDNSGETILFVAMGTDDQHYKFRPAVISTRKIKFSPLAVLEYLFNDSGYFSYLDINENSRSIFKVEYIHSFEEGIYGYYLSNQQGYESEGISGDSGRIIQFCLHTSDCSYQSYKESFITCTKDSLKYNIILAAYKTKYGLDSDRAYKDADYVYILFGLNRDSSLKIPDYSFGTAMCVFTVDIIESHFKENVMQNCYVNKKGFHPWWVHGTRIGCNLAPNWNLLENKYLEQCVHDSNQAAGIEGIEEFALDDTAILFFNQELLTSIVVLNQSSKVVAFLGNATGHIKKVGLNRKTWKDKLTLYFDYDVSGDSQVPVQRDMEIDKLQKNLYILTGDKVTNFHVDNCEVYTTCSACLSSQDPMGCSWSQIDSKCTNTSECHIQCSNDTCPPHIQWIEPFNGPTAGGTKLTITGTDFGIRPPTVQIVKQQPVSCMVISNTNNKIICTIGETTLEEAGEVTVTATDSSRINVSYSILGTDIYKDHKFYYKAPTLTSVHPLYGPKSGGTNITLTGTYLDIGTKESVQIVIGNIPCTVYNRTDTQILCSSGKLADSLRRRRGVGREILLQIDNAKLKYSDTYEYRPDANITVISPKLTVASGGTYLTVTGANLNVVQKPQVGVVNTERTKKSKVELCNASSDGQRMICPSPSVKEISDGITDPANPKRMQLFFQMDGIEKLNNFYDTYVSESKISYYPDPFINQFEGDQKVRYFKIEENELDIKGNNLNYGATRNDYFIMIGRSYCNVTTLEKTVIRCLPVDIPKTVSSNEPRQEVEVHIGIYLKYEIGYLVYTSDKIRAAGPDLMLIILVTIMVMVVVALMVLCIIMKWKKIGFFRDKLDHPSVRYIPGREMDTTEENQRMFDMQNKSNEYADKSAIGRPLIDESTINVLKDAGLLINRNWLRLGDIIGQGNFGCVFRGYLTLPDDNLENLVAVKTLHQNNPRDIDIDSFLSEAMIMKDFHHLNVLQLIGICLGLDDMPLVVLPFMKHGDVLSFIRNEKNVSINPAQLDEELRVKVADFGLSRDIYERDYYTSDNKKSKLPVKWMAPESLEKGSYNSKSDVWSYGVVLWELMTRGVNPYPEVDNWDIVRYLKKGRRLPQPQYCPDQLFTVMQKCWLMDAHSRPTFSELAREIQDMMTVLEQAMHQGQQRTNIQSTYVNVADSSNYHYAPDDREPLSSTSDVETDPQSIVGNDKAPETLDEKGIQSAVDRNKAPEPHIGKGKAPMKGGKVKKSPIKVERNGAEPFNAEKESVA
ncbi:hypothetical protein ACJMK2_015458 [Sinanodonta woodiana]|uniref:Hepatocyte growth factor receptor n=1 Tax=Sinanodonta woodiana TaxID=1069815 RepID=A0ABD3URN7_SINWO